VMKSRRLIASSAGGYGIKPACWKRTMSALGQKQAMSGRRPLYPQKRTLKLSRVMSAMCQKRTLTTIQSPS
jgi:hypothetical protein